MNWIVPLIFFAGLAAMLLLRRIGQLSLRAAQEHLRNGALLVDVRSEDEFAAGHLPNALNFPVNEIESQLPGKIRDRNQVLLLYCQSGIRSGIARRKLRAMGYAHALQLGSYTRAAQSLGTR